MKYDDCALVQHYYSGKLLQFKMKRGAVYGFFFFPFSEYWIFCKADDIDDIASCFLMLCYLAHSKCMHVRINWRFLIKYFPAFLSHQK